MLKRKPLLLTLTPELGVTVYGHHFVSVLNLQAFGEDRALSLSAARCTSGYDSKNANKQLNH